MLNNTLDLRMMAAYFKNVTATSVAEFDSSNPQDAPASYYSMRRFFCACIIDLWRVCVGSLRACRIPCGRSVNLRTSAAHCLTAMAGGFLHSQGDRYAR